MENNVKAKGILILIVATIALYYAFPTYQAYFSDYDPQTRANKVNLGLDLQGGMYLDIEVKVEEAEKAVYDEYERRCQTMEDGLSKRAQESEAVSEQQIRDFLDSQSKQSEERLRNEEFRLHNAFNDRVDD